MKKTQSEINLKEITFYNPIQSAVDIFPPTPAKKTVPSWYKDISDQSDFAPSIKNCHPVQDIITSGYILKSSIEYDVSISTNETNTEIFETQCPMGIQADIHTHEQFPIVKEGVKKTFLKLNTGWSIKTPKGYSCLLMQPFYFLEDRFTVLPAIVDTDMYDGSISFPLLINKKNVIIEPGTPLVQVIPFKRDDWESKVQQKNSSSILELFIPRPFAGIYRKFCKSKKKFN